jgi:energy-coupling factor transport system ATP-binding protein
VIEFRSVTFTYPSATGPALRAIDLEVGTGELCLVVGPTGSGKTTLLSAVNGLVPRFTGGVLAGRVTVDGRDTRRHDLKAMADLVGMVPQDPTRSFVTETVEDELAFTMEHLGVDPLVMRTRVEETLDLMGLADLRRRRLRTLSGGQAQRVAIGAVLTAHPRVLVLDEPTSALDPTGAEDVLAALLRLVHDVGTTVLVAEHRLERVIQYADRLVQLGPDGSARSGSPAAVMETSPVAPPVVELGRLAGWSPLPLSIRDARRLAPDLTGRLGPPPSPAPLPASKTVARARGLTVVHREVVAVRSVDLDVGVASVTALMGRNGAGKSSLLWALHGAGRRDGGTVEIDGRDPATLEPDQARGLVGLVPQEPSDLLYLETVGEECRRADEQAGTAVGTCLDLTRLLVGGVDPATHPADLSEGRRLGLVLAIQLTARPRLVLLDEPTRGLDYHAKRRLGSILGDLAEQGHAVIVATHDVEFVAETAQRVWVMAAGEIVADGPTADVVVASPAYAPQVSKVLGPARWLTVGEVAARLGREAV